MQRKMVARGLSDDLGTSVLTADAAIEAVLNAFTRALASGDEIHLQGFGHFKRRDLKRVKLAKHRHSVAFKPSERLKLAANGKLTPAELALSDRIRARLAALADAKHRGNARVAPSDPRIVMIGELGSRLTSALALAETKPVRVNDATGNQVAAFLSEKAFAKRNKSGQFAAARTITPGECRKLLAGGDLAAELALYALRIERTGNHPPILLIAEGLHSVGAAHEPRGKKPRAAARLVALPTRRRRAGGTP